MAGDSLYNMTMARMALLKKQVQQHATLGRPWGRCVMI